MLKTAKKPVRTTLKVEGLEDRLTPAIMFYSNAGGTEAYDARTAAFRHIENTRAVKIAEGSDGILVASYKTGAHAGTWVYNYDWNQWAQISRLTATAMDAPSGGGNVFLTLQGGLDGNIYRTGGTYSWSVFGGMKQITTSTASQIEAVDGDTFFGVYGNGTFRYDQGKWLQVSAFKPSVMAASTDGTLMASYGDGTFTWNGSWRKISAAASHTIGGKVGNTVIAGFGNGVFSYDLGTGRWTQMNSKYASVVAVGQSGALSGDLFASFADSQGGLTVYRPGSWGTWLPFSGAAEQIAR